MELAAALLILGSGIRPDPTSASFDPWGGGLERWARRGGMTVPTDVTVAPVVGITREQALVGEEDHDPRRLEVVLDGDEGLLEVAEEAAGISDDENLEGACTGSREHRLPLIRLPGALPSRRGNRPLETGGFDQLGLQNSVASGDLPPSRRQDSGRLHLIGFRLRSPK